MWIYIFFSILICMATAFTSVKWSTAKRLLRNAERIRVLLLFACAFLSCLFHFCPYLVPMSIADALFPLTEQLVQERPWLGAVGPRPWLVLAVAFLLTALSPALRSFRSPCWLFCRGSSCNSSAQSVQSESLAASPQVNHSSPVVSVGLVSQCPREKMTLIYQLNRVIENGDLPVSLSFCDRAGRRPISVRPRSVGTSTPLLEFSDLTASPCNPGDCYGGHPANVAVLWHVVSCPPRNAGATEWQAFQQDLRSSMAYIRTTLDEARHSSPRILAMILTQIEICYDSEKLARVHLPRLLTALSRHIGPLLAHPKLDKAAVFPVSLRGFGIDGDAPAAPFNLLLPLFWSVHAAVESCSDIVGTAPDIHIRQTSGENLETVNGWIWPLK